MEANTKSAFKIDRCGHTPSRPPQKVGHPRLPSVTAAKTCLPTPAFDRGRLFVSLTISSTDGGQDFGPTVSLAGDDPQKSRRHGPLFLS